MTLENYEIELSNLIPNAIDLIPSNFNFIKNIAVEIKLAEGINDKSYCNDITLQVRVVGIFDKKFKIINEAMNIDLKLNNFKFKNYDRIVREDVWYTNYIDKDKFNVVLMYKIRNYK